MINYKRRKNHKAQIQMTMGTLVTIVLLTMVLILGGYFVSRIFRGATENIDSIDAAVKTEISKLFSAEESRKIVIYPSYRKITIKQGEQGSGFAFSIRNIGEAATFSYSIKAHETDCSISVSEADSFLALGKEGDINIPSRSIMGNPKLVTFKIPETAPPCTVEYFLDIDDERGEPYESTVDIHLNIK